MKIKNKICIFSVLMLLISGCSSIGETGVGRKIQDIEPINAAQGYDSDSVSVQKFKDYLTNYINNHFDEDKADKILVKSDENGIVLELRDSKLTEAVVKGTDSGSMKLYRAWKQQTQSLSNLTVTIADSALSHIKRNCNCTAIIVNTDNPDYALTYITNGNILYDYMSEQNSDAFKSIILEKDTDDESSNSKSDNIVVEASDSSYESILENYSQQMKNKVSILINEYRSESAKYGNDIESLAELVNEKVEVLAEICNDGMTAMAEKMYKDNDSYSTYEKWTMKLMDVYQEQAQKIYDVYIDQAA